MENPECKIEYDIQSDPLGRQPLNEQLQAVEKITQGTNSFTLRVFEVLCKLKSDVNVVASPLSLQVILALACTGATGKTAEEIATALNIPTDTKEMLEGYHSLVCFFKNPSIRFAAKIFIETSIDFNEDFNENALTYFESDVEKVNFHDDCNAAIKFINTSVKKKTHKKIKKIFSEGDLDADTDLVLLNAVHFKPNWKEPFSEGATYPDTFYISEEETIDIDMMFDSDKYRYKNHAGLDSKILEIPYENDEFKMFIILPNEINGIKKLQDDLSKLNLANEFACLDICSVDVTLPKFEIYETICYNDILNTIGIKEMFNKENSEFSGISNSKIAVSKVIQRAVIKVDEKGPDIHMGGMQVKAGSFQLLDEDDDEDSEQFKANHPFLFIISKIMSKENLILFIGNFIGE